MHNLFPVYRRPTQEEFSNMWREGVFAFDANVLLNVYRYTPETRERFFEVLKRLNARIWIPHQAASEYYKNRLAEVSGLFKVFEEIETDLKTSLNKLEKLQQKHPLGIDSNPLTEVIKDAFQKANPFLKEVKSQHHKLLSFDPMEETIAKLFYGKFGEPYPKSELEKIYKKAVERFEQQIPPGYKDNDKKGDERYGDVVIWFQLLHYAKTQKKSMIFITDDSKEDWWLQHKGKTIGPRPELVQEMSSEAGVLFHIYSSDAFVEQAQSFLELQDTQATTAVEEVREIRQQKEVDKKLYDEISLLTSQVRLNSQEISQLAEAAKVRINFQKALVTAETSIAEQIKEILQSRNTSQAQTNFQELWRAAEASQSQINFQELWRAAEASQCLRELILDKSVQQVSQLNEMNLGESNQGEEKDQLSGNEIQDHQE